MPGYKICLLIRTRGVPPLNSQSNHIFTFTLYPLKAPNRWNWLKFPSPDVVNFLHEGSPALLWCGSTLGTPDGNTHKCSAGPTDVIAHQL